MAARAGVEHDRVVTLVGVGLPVVSISLGSAFFFALSSVAKHVSAAKGPMSPTLQPSSIGRFALGTARQPLWLAGAVADVAGLALQVIALHLGALTVVQPLLLSGLVFAILLRGVVSRRVPVRQAGWAIVVAAALGAFLVISQGAASPARSAVDRAPSVVGAACGLALVSAAVFCGARVRAVSIRAGLMGAAAGTLYAASAALIKVVSNLALQGFLPVVAGWQVYALIVVGVAGLIVGQIAFQSGPMSAALPVASTVDPLVAMVIGVAIFDERLRLGPGHGAVLIGLLAALGVAVVRLALLGDTEDHPALPEQLEAAAF